MAFSLDDSFFSGSITDMQDAPKSSGSSSASRFHPQRSYARYYSRMSSVDCDKTFISDPRRGCYIVLSMFIFFFFSFFFHHFCPGHISGTVTRRDSKLSVLLGPAV